MATADIVCTMVEIKSRIRETQGLSEIEQHIIKVAGVLNLVSRGGIFARIKGHAGLCVGISPGSTKFWQGSNLVACLSMGNSRRISHWQATDFDLHGAIDDARRRFRSESVAQVCDRALPLAPLVAARHSQDKGILRFFDRSYADSSGVVRRSSANTHADGLLLYVVDDTPPEAFAEAAVGTTAPCSWCTQATVLD